MSEPRNIVIVGGGFAGTTLARALSACFPRATASFLVSEESYTTFNPMLGRGRRRSGVSGARGRTDPADAAAREPLRDGPGDRHRRRARVLTASTLAGRQEIAYEHLVLAFGTRANTDLVPGSPSMPCR
jgi:NADH dehydrogenase